MISTILSSYGLYNVLTRLGQMAEIPAIENFVQSFHA